VPAVIPDMLMPHRLLQHQQQGFSTAGVAAAGWADAGEAGEALPMQHQQRNQQQESLQAAAAAAAGHSNLAGMTARPSQAGSGTSRLLAFSDAPSFSGRFLLGQGLLPAEQHQPHQQQQQHDTLQQLERQLQGQPPVQQHQQQQGDAHARHAAQSETGELDHEQEVPWKGRLSFGGILDEPTPPSSTTHAGPGAAAVGAGDENTVPAGLTAATALQQQQQQHAYRRPSPIVGSCQQQKGTASQPSNSSLRPPLHPSTTPVHLRTGHHGTSTAAGGGGGGGGGDDRMSQQQQQHRQGGSMMPSDAGMAVASRQRRSVSDLSAALSSAAAAAAPVGAAGLLNPLAPLLGMPRVNQQQQQHQQHSVLEGHPVSAGCMQLPTSTPAAAAAHGVAASSATEAGGDGMAGADVDTACPMSLGTSARKRTRTVFEVAPTGGPAAAGTEQQQQGANGGDTAMLFSSDRRVVRGRRSSITSGCCSMETDAPEGQAAAGADGHAGQQQHGAAGGLAGAGGQLSAEDRSMSITSICMHADMAGALAQHHQHQQRELQQQQRGLQELSDMPPPHAVQPRAAAVAAAAAGTGPESHAPGQHGAHGNSSSGHASLPGSGGSTCPMSLDHRASTATRQHTQQPGSSAQQQQQPTGSGAGLQGLEGLSSGDLVTGGRPAADELRSMDPAELAELAKFWRPRLDSAERRYLRCRTMQLGEALLQVRGKASQQCPRQHTGLCLRPLICDPQPDKDCCPLTLF